MDRIRPTPRTLVRHRDDLRSMTKEAALPPERLASGDQLPARDLVDVRLAAIMGRPGCPACRGRVEAERRYLDTWLYERVNDVTTRRELDRRRGLCDGHIHALLGADRGRGGGSLGTAILYEAMLRPRLAELRTAASARGRTRGKRLAEAAAPAACVVCHEATAGE